MASLPARVKEKGTRRHYAQIIAFVLKLAVYPCKVIERSPLPVGFLPKLGPPKVFPFLHPAEDLQLLKCAAIPIGLRALYGFTAREGMRISEAMALTWGDLAVFGSVRLDRNKTNRPRAWVLSPGVATALQRLRGNAPDSLGPSRKSTTSSRLS